MSSSLFLAKTVVMVRPLNFGFNDQTSASNTFQHDVELGQSPQELALKEFEGFRDTLEKQHVNVCVLDDSNEPPKPDAIFPNNWFSSFPGRPSLALYLMATENRRAEVRKELVEKLCWEFKLQVELDLSSSLSSSSIDDGEKKEEEDFNKFLEGTGSLVFDHEYKICYAAVSPRTHPDLVKVLCTQFGYQPLLFGTSAHGKPVYHTNVMLAMGLQFCVVCSECIDVEDRDRVISSLRASNKEIIDITLSEMDSFAGNMLLIQSNLGEPLLVLSQTAYQALEPSKLTRLASFCRLVPVSIPTIEKIGGGSARCMLAEIFPQP